RAVDTGDQLTEGDSAAAVPVKWRASADVSGSRRNVDPDDQFVRAHFTILIAIADAGSERWGWRRRGRGWGRRLSGRWRERTSRGGGGRRNDGCERRRCRRDAERVCERRGWRASRSPTRCRG